MCYSIMLGMWRFKKHGSCHQAMQPLAGEGLTYLHNRKRIKEPGSLGKLSGIACALKHAKSDKEQHRNKRSIPALAQWRTFSSKATLARGGREALGKHSSWLVSLTRPPTPHPLPTILNTHHQSQLILFNILAILLDVSGNYFMLHQHEISCLTSTSPNSLCL